MLHSIESRRQHRPALNMFVISMETFYCHMLKRPNVLTITIHKTKRTRQNTLAHSGTGSAHKNIRRPGNRLHCNIPHANVISLTNIPSARQKTHFHAAPPKSDRCNLSKSSAHGKTMHKMMLFHKENMYMCVYSKQAKHRASCSNTHDSYNSHAARRGHQMNNRLAFSHFLGNEPVCFMI